jgi:hypothetical protein
MTSFAGPYLSCSARAIVKPSDEERIPFHGYTNMYSAVDFARSSARHCCTAASVSLAVGLSLLECSAAAVSELKPALCVVVVSARA